VIGTANGKSWSSSREILEFTFVQPLAGLQIGNELEEALLVEEFLVRVLKLCERMRVQSTSQTNILAKDPALALGAGYALGRELEAPDHATLGPAGDLVAGVDDLRVPLDVVCHCKTQLLLHQCSHVLAALRAVGQSKAGHPIRLFKAHLTGGECEFPTFLMTGSLTTFNV
jgi:hypothetical protein